MDKSVHEQRSNSWGRILLIKEKIEKWIDDEAATVQPVLNWLLATGCKAKITQ